MTNLLSHVCRFFWNFDQFREYNPGYIIHTFWLHLLNNRVFNNGSSLTCGMQDTTLYVTKVSVQKEYSTNINASLPLYWCKTNSYTPSECPNSISLKTNEPLSPEMSKMHNKTSTRLMRAIICSGRCRSFDSCTARRNLRLISAWFCATLRLFSEVTQF